MIFAPRSWPSSPGFAITTRIFRSTWAVYGGEIHRHRLSPAWPNPGGAHSGYLLEHAGAAARRLWAGSSGGFASVKAGRTSMRSRSRTSTSTTGATLCPGSGARCTARPASRSTSVPSSGSMRVGGRAGAVRRAVRIRDMFDRVFTVREYEPERAVHGRRLRGDADAATALHPRDVRVQARGRRDDDRVLRRQRPERAPGRARARSDLFVCEATLDRGEDDGQPRGHLSADEAIEAAEDAAVKRLLLTHRPAELAVPDGDREGLRRARAGADLRVGRGQAHPVEALRAPARSAPRREHDRGHHDDQRGGVPTARSSQAVDRCRVRRNSVVSSGGGVQLHLRRRHAVRGP